MYFATGNVFDIFESPLYSLQPEYFAAIKYRPLTLILVGVRDRYGVALAEGVDVIECSLRDAYQYCLHQRLISETAEGGSTLRTWDVDSIAAGDTDVLAHLRAGNRALGEQNAELRKALRLEKERAAHLRAAAGLVRELDPQIPRTIDTATNASLNAVARRIVAEMQRLHSAASAAAPDAVAERALRQVRRLHDAAIAARLATVEAHIADLRAILEPDEDGEEDGEPAHYLIGWANCWWCRERAIHVWPAEADNCQLECGRCGLCAVVPERGARGYDPDEVSR